MRRKMFLMAGVVVVLLGGLAGMRLMLPCAPSLAVLDRLLPRNDKACAAVASAPGSDSKLTKRAPLPPAVTVVQVLAHDFVDRFFVSGTLVARDEAMVGAQIDGLRIVELLADDGDHVAK